MKSTAIAPSNIAFIKYWGKKQDNLRLPYNDSLSMCLSDAFTTTTVEFSKNLKQDNITIDGKENLKKNQRVIKHLDLIRNTAKTDLKARVVSKNNFPSGTGISSSASGLAALTMATCEALSLNLSTKEISELARQGSGSACRSVPDGFVEWVSYEDGQSFAQSIFPENHWNILDIVAVVNTGQKDVSSTEGQKVAHTSPFFGTRLQKISAKFDLCKAILAKKDFSAFGRLIEAEALELHSIMLTSSPSLIYWEVGTLKLMKAIKKWRAEEGLEAYFTINTGQDVHIICQEKDANQVIQNLKQIEEVRGAIVNYPSKGARIDTKASLF
jgi:diphosphomevalonate decarboxylase